MVKKALAGVALAAMLAVGGGVGGGVQVQDPVAKPSGLELLTPFVGHEYVIEAEWMGGGGKLNARETWEWGLNKKFIVCKVFVANGPGPNAGEYQRYESVFANDDGKLVGYHMDFTGHVRTGNYSVNGNELLETWAVKNAAGADVNLKQLLTLRGVGDGYHWQVWSEKDGKWEPMMDGEWKRKG